MPGLVLVGIPVTPHGGNAAQHDPQLIQIHSQVLVTLQGPSCPFLA